jgi:hypothetical protein
MSLETGIDPLGDTIRRLMTRITERLYPIECPAQVLAGPETGVLEAREEVEIRADNGRIYRLAPSRPRLPVTGLPNAGSCRVLFVVPKKFEAPLEELRE